MYRRKTGLTLAFHGCDVEVATSVVHGQADLKHSRNSYDWLGHGTYFWESDPDRAIAYAETLAARKMKDTKINVPGVIGAVIDLGNCLDLMDYRNLAMVRQAYDSLLAGAAGNPEVLPKNRRDLRTGDVLLRDLDCAVIQLLHEIWVHDLNQPPFDSVRGVFWEGNELYPNAGFREKDHIQICVRNPNCIKGFFLPRKEDSKFQPV